jgi:hypothetical protein
MQGSVSNMPEASAAACVQATAAARPHALYAGKSAAVVPSAAWSHVQLSGATM